ncbi:MAG: HAMP domain-containing histidine kinase, partial [Clostridiales bacterium]|nr:HAMP domain-containing histidine kinase [Clostridiales bacterium]
MAETARQVPFLHSMRAKFALTYIVIIAAVLILLNTYPLLVSQDLVFQSKQAALQNQASVISSALAVSETLTPEGVEQAILLLDATGFSRILVTNAAGLILYDTQKEEGDLYQYALLWEMVSALRGNDVFFSVFSDGAFLSRAAAPVVSRGNCIGAVCLYEYDTEQGALLLGVQRNLRTISVVLCVVVLLLSAVFSKALTRRIAALLSAIRTVREGEYNHRLHLAGGDELTQLAGEFNQLTDRLQTTEEVRRRFVSDASHELKTPLASIRLLADSILQNQDIDTGTVREFVSDIGREADRLTRISEKLLTLTRLDTGQPAPAVPVDVSAVAARVCRMLTPLAENSGITVQTALDDRCTVLATVDDLYQIIFNLVENAIKYNLPGGRVTVALSLTRGPEETADLLLPPGSAASPEEPWVVLRIEDTGIGIPEEDLPLIFGRFYRVDKARSR